MLLRYWIFAGLAVTAPAQTFTTLVNFNGANGPMSAPSSTIRPWLGALTETFTGQLRQTRLLTVARFSKSPPGGTLTTLNSFPFAVTTAYGGLVQASDGNLYGTTYGPTSTPVVSGSETRSGSLNPLPVITIGIGGTHATVQFAGLISPGLYQFNVVVPASTPAGDNALTATYAGLTAQACLLRWGHSVPGHRW